MRKSLTILAGVAALCLLACKETAPAQRIIDFQSPGPGNIRVVSYNIRLSFASKADGDNGWEFRKDATLNMIEREQPTVFGLQEALPDQLAYIEAAFPQYKRIGVGRDDGIAAGECMAIYWFADEVELCDSGTFWLSETPDVVSRGWDAACNRTVTWAVFLDNASGKNFVYLNTHLDHMGEVARRESLKLIASWVDENVYPGEPVFIGGDFNSDVGSDIFQPLWDLGFESARDIAPETDHKGSFNAWGAAPSTVLLDHVLVRSCRPLNFKTLDGDYGAPYISDHYPVEALIDISQKSSI